MKELNILISSAGRRVELIQCFREALEDNGISGSVCAADCSLDAPAMYLADKAWQVPRCQDPEFIPDLLDLAVGEGISVIVPTIDDELIPLTLHRALFAQRNVHVCVSALEAVLVSVDKEATHMWLVENGFPTVAQSNPADILSHPSECRYPLLMKPRFGSGSRGVRYVKSLDELRICSEGESDLIVQTLAAGCEYTINVFVNRAGKCVCAVPHRRLEVRSGEVSKAATVKNSKMMMLAHEIAEALAGAHGPLNIQCFLSPEGDLTVIELNARFGGGYPLAHRAGARFTHWIVEEALGLPDATHLNEWADDFWMLRYDQTVFQPGYKIRSTERRKTAVSGVGSGRYTLSRA